MKPILISSAIALVIGFSFGWLFKSSSQDIDPTTQQTPAINHPNKRTSSSSPDDTPLPNRPKRPNNNTYKPLPTDPYIPPVSDAQLAAKWHRLSESLSLTKEQTDTIAALIEKNHPDKTGESELHDAIRVASENLEKDILASLTPEQQQAFRELQNRALLNQLSAKAMRFYSDELASLDLTPQQRQQAIDSLVGEYQQSASTIPNSTRLLLSGSFLPVTGNTISDEGYTLLSSIGQTAGADQIAELRRTELQQKLKRFEGILTPAQLRLYQNSVEESLNNLEVVFPK